MLAINRSEFDHDEDGEAAILADINVTPLTDVFLVLLIIFMVTTSAAVDLQRQNSGQGQGAGEEAGGIEVDLPRASVTATLTDKQDIQVWIGADGTVMFDERPVDAKELAQEFRTRAKADPDTLVVLRADTAVPHGRVVEIMDLATQEGLSRLAVATLPADAAGP